jgi:ribonuclease P protein component
LTSSADIQALFQQGKRIDKPALLVLWRDTDSQRRAGFAVTRQIRGAVRRNRARRRLREAFRTVREAAPSRIAVVIVAKRAALDEPFARLAAQLRDAFSAIPGARTRT